MQEPAVEQADPFLLFTRLINHALAPALEVLFYHLKSRILFMEALMPDREGCDPRSHCWSMLRELVIEQRLYTVGVRVKEAFSAKLQRKLATMAPPRPTIELTLDEAHHALWRLYDDIEEAIRVRDFKPGHSPRNLFVSYNYLNHDFGPVLDYGST